MFCEYMTHGLGVYSVAGKARVGDGSGADWDWRSWPWQCQLPRCWRGRLGWTPGPGDWRFCSVPELLEHSYLSFDGFIAV